MKHQLLKLFVNNNNIYTNRCYKNTSRTHHPNASLMKSVSKRISYGRDEKITGTRNSSVPHYNNTHSKTQVRKIGGLLPHNAGYYNLNLKSR